MCKKICWIVLFSFLLLNSNACNNFALESSPTNLPSAEIVQSALAEGQPEPSVQLVAADGSGTQQSTATPAAVHTITPAAPGTPEGTKKDIDTSSNASRKMALGDSFRLGIFERPFTTGDMNYVADIDLLDASISSDENFLYFVLNFENNGIDVDHPDAHYGVEFDTDFDSRGDILLWVQANGAFDWSTDGVNVFEDANQDVGGSRPVMSDSSQGDGYESVLFSSIQMGDPDSRICGVHTLPAMTS